METRFKLPTKVLSTFLAVLMAVSCFGIALPNLVPEARAAAGTLDYKSLSDAFLAVDEYGNIDSSKYSVSSGTAGELLIEDNTENGDVYKLAKALFKVANADSGSFKHNKFIRERIKSVFEKNGYVYTSSMEGFINILLPIDGNYSYVSSAPKKGTPQSASAGEPVPEFKDPLTSVVKVTRSVKSVLLSYDNVNDVPGKLDVTVKYTTTANPKSSKKEFTDAQDQKWVQLLEWYENGETKVEDEQTNSPDLAPLKKYIGYTRSSAFAPYYEAYKQNSNSVYTLTEEESVALSRTNYDEKYNTTALNALDNYIFEKFFTLGDGADALKGIAAKNAVESFINAVTAAAPAVVNRKYVDWVMKGTSVKGIEDRDSYLPQDDGNGNITEPSKKTVLDLFEDAKNVRDIVNDATNNNIYVNQYGYQNGKIEELIDKISIVLQGFTLNKIMEGVVFRMENTSDKYYDNNLSYFGLADYDSSTYAPGTMPITDEMLDAAIDWFADQMAEAEKEKGDNEEMFDEAGRDAAVAAAGSATVKTYAQVKAFYDKLVAERQSANRKESNLAIANFHKYFDSFINHAHTLDTVYMTTAYETGINEKVNECIAARRDAANKLGTEAANKIYGTEQDIRNKGNSAKEAINTALNARLYAQCKLMESYASGGITVANFSLVKAQYGNINNKIIPAVVDGKETEISLYQWCKNHGYSGADGLYNKYNNNYKTEIEKIVAKKWTDFEPIKLSTDNVYTVRHVLPTDMVRYLAGDGAANERYPYEITTGKVNTVITKLDTFLTSESFTQLLGVDGESEYTGNTISNLSEYIEDILIANVFSDKMVNTIVSALFPMLTKTLTDLLTKDLGKLLGGLGTTPTDPNADVAIDLRNLSLGKLKIKGPLNVYLNGKEGTNPFTTVFRDIGLSIHPVNLAAKLEAANKPAQYKKIIEDLRKANADWMWFDRIENGGNGDGEVNAKDFIKNVNGKPVLDSKKREQPKYTWGVNNYDTFVDAMGDVFSAAMGILKAVFTQYTFKTPNMNNLLRAKGSPRVEYGILPDNSVPMSVINSHTYLTIQGMKGYSDVWAPIFEGLGINKNTPSYDLTSLNTTTPLSSTFGSSGNNATNAQFVNALFIPLMSLIKELSNAPISTLTGILPNVANAVAYNMVSPLVNGLTTTLNLSTGLHMDKLEVFGIPVSGIANRFIDKEGLINQNIDLKLGEMLDLNALLAKQDIDITDLNSIANKVINGLGKKTNTEKKVDLPAINSGKLAHLGQRVTLNSVRTQNQNSSLAGGKYYYVQANKADVLYDLLSWVLTFISGEGNLSGLMAAIGSKGLGADIDSILAEIKPDAALAALVEMFLPRGLAGSGYANGYDFAPFNWYSPKEGEWSYGVSYTAFVYTKYENFWTKEKANYLYENLETVANDVIKKYAPDLFKKNTKDADGNDQYYDGLSDWLVYTINKMFDNDGIHNFTKAFSRIGGALIGNPTVLDLLYEQINGGQGIDLACWYNTFGYLDYDYAKDGYDDAVATLADASATEDEKAAAIEVIETAPLRPGEVRSYTDLEGVVKTVTYNEKRSFEKLTVNVYEGYKNSDEYGPLIDPLTGNIASYKNVKYKWTYNDITLVDNGTSNARKIFTDIFVYLFTPALPLVNLILTGTDLTLFNNALVIKGYDCYSNGLVPLMEMLGMRDLPTTADFKAMSASEGLNTLVDKLFNYVDNLLTPDIDANGKVTLSAAQKVIKLLPGIYYFLQSDGISTILKNLLQPVWVLIDTLRPIADADIDTFIHQFLCDYLELAYDKTAAPYKANAVVELIMNQLNKKKIPKTYTAQQIADDKDKVDAIFGLTVEDLSLDTIYQVVELMFGIDLKPISYAFEGMCLPFTEDGKQYGKVSFESARGKTDYTLSYTGGDTLTVTLSALLDCLRWKDNAAGFDRLFGFVKDKFDRESNLTAKGLLEALEIVFEGKAFDLGKQPNWDYLFEGKEVDGNAWVDISADSVDYDQLTHYAGADISAYHSIYNLKYLTDWTEDTAKANVGMLANVLDFVATMLKKQDGSKPANFKDYIDDLLNAKVFNGELLKKLTGLMCNIYNALPASAIDLLNVLLSKADENKFVDLTYWRETYLTLGTNAQGVEEWVVKKDYKWWGNPSSADYVNNSHKFFAAFKDILDPVAPVFAWLFLQEDIKLFYTIGDEIGNKTLGYGTDAITLDGVGIYDKAVIPLLEALGYDLAKFRFVSDGLLHDVTTGTYNYIGPDGATMTFDSVAFIDDFIEILHTLVTEITSDPINWLIDRLPGVVYFINANGLTTIVENVFDSLEEVLETINTQLDADKQINLAALAKLINDLVGNETTDITGELGNKLVLDFDTVIALLEKFTGIHINSTLVSFMKGLYVGEIKAFTSGNGRQSFTMVYSTDKGENAEEKHDMVTILLALLLEIVEDKGVENGVAYDNPAALDKLITKADEENKGLVSAIVDALRNPKDIVEKDINWDYFKEDGVVATLPDVSDPNAAANQKVVMPVYKYLYLNYTTNWTHEKAKGVKNSLNDLVLGIIKMSDKDGKFGPYTDDTNVAEVLGKVLALDKFYTAENLNKLLNLLSGLLYGQKATIPSAILEFAGALLGADLSAWEYKYAFEAKQDGVTYNAPDESGLSWREGEITTDEPAVDDDNNPILDAEGNPTYVKKTGRIYAVSVPAGSDDLSGRNDFIKGATFILQPAYRLLAWLLLGADYTFFNAETPKTNPDGTPVTDPFGNPVHDTLITLKGANGYGNSLSYLLEALGCVGGNTQLKAYSTYIVKDETTGKDVYKMQELVNDVLNVICNRVDKIMTDPVMEILNMIPELIYFINANGLAVCVNNLLAGLITMISSPEVEAAVGMKLNVNDLVTDILQKQFKNDSVTFDIDAVNIDYILSLVELLTSIDIRGAIGSNLKYFYMGDLVSYRSASGKLAFRAQFSDEELHVINDGENGNGQLSDFITILFSMVIDVLRYKENAAAIVQLAKLDIDVQLIEGIIAFISEEFKVETLPYDWFYFDETHRIYELDPVTGKLKVKDDYEPITPDTPANLPVHHASYYLTYASDWTAETADYIYRNRNDIIATVLKMAKADSTDLGQLLWGKVDFNAKLYTKETLQKILDKVKPILGNLDDSILNILGIALDINLLPLKNFTLDDKIVNDRTSFVNVLTQMLKPLTPILDWLLFGHDIKYFDKKNYDTNEIEVLINLRGAYGYYEGLVPLLEALGVILPDGNKTEDILYPLINNVLARLEVILKNPVDEVIALLPELLYFINANGLATCINNLLAGIVVLLDKVAPALGADAPQSAEELINSLLKDVDFTLDLSKLDLLAIVKILEEALGIHMTEIFTEKKIDNFFFGKIVYNDKSASKTPTFKMIYSEEEGPKDMLTFIVNLAIEVLLYKDEANGVDNAKALDYLINGKDEITGEPKKNTVQAIVKMLLGIKSAEPIELNWNYFDESAVLGDTITVPNNTFVYLNYSNDWTYKKAAYLSDNLDNIILEVLKLSGSNASSVADLINLDLNKFLNADTLNKLLDTLKKFLYGDDSVLNETLFELIGLVLGADLTQWKDSYKFEATVEGVTYEGQENGLWYRTVDGVKTYAVGNANNFADGLALVLKPAERLLGWLLLGDSYGFFVPNSNGNILRDENGNPILDENGNVQVLDDELIKLTGAKGYDTALLILLEALGCKNLRSVNEFTSCGEMLASVIKSAVARIDEVLKDPVNEALALIPEIIYFINAGGLNAVVNNLAGPVLALLKEAEPLTGKAVDIDTLLTDVLKKALGDKAPADFKFTLEGVNLQWAIDLVEIFTGLEIGDAIGYGLEKFALGVVEKYDSKSTSFTETYRMRFDMTGNGEDNARDRADLITILFSIILDVLEYDPTNDGKYPNADALAKLINNDKVTAEMIKGIITVLKGYVIDGVKPIDWFYFDKDKTVYEIVNGKRVVKNPLPEFTEDSVTGVPENTINYLTYASDWNKETAKYLNDNLEAVIAEILKMTGQQGSTAADIIENAFRITDLYTADNLNAIVKLVKGLTDKLGETLTNMAGMILGADLSAYATMNFTAAQIKDRETFVNGLVEVLTPLVPLLDWLLFGDSLKFFSAKDTPVLTDVVDLINITGYEGYATGLVPLLEALGLTLTDCTAITSATELLKPTINSFLERIEKILADPVNEVLGLLPNLLYFINANGLSASVQNLLGAVFGLLETVNPILGDKKINVNDLINDLLKKNNINAVVDIDDLDLLAIVKVLEAATGLKIVDVVTANKLDNFRIGEIKYFRSSNGKAAFKMVYSDTQGRIDMLTVLVNFLIEVAMADGNAAALESLLKLDAGTVSKVVALLKGQDGDFAYKAFNWNYFDKNVDLSAQVTTVPVYSFVYLNYANDWTYEKAAFLDEGLKDLVNGVLRMIAKDGDPVTVEDLIAQKVDLNKLVFNADILNKLLTTVSGLFYGDKAVIGKHLGEVAGLLLGGELSEWNDNYSFVEFDASATYLTDSETGLRYTVDNGKAIFAIENSDDFIAGLVKILKPLGKVLGWLLLGDSYAFFVPNSNGNVDEHGNQLNNELIKINGKLGYKNGLGYLLEALGVKELKSEYANADEMLKDVLTKLVARVYEILGNPIDEVLALIPELIYFINANGLGVTVYNLLASVMNIYDTVKASGLIDSIGQIKDYNNGEELVNGLVDKIIKEKVSPDITFNLSGINLEWILQVVEALTGLDLRSHIRSLEKFAIGEVYGYTSVSGATAYKMRYGRTGNGTDELRARDRADMITIVLSYVIDLLTIKENQPKLEELLKLNAGTIASVLALLSDYKIDLGVNINWFYFDPDVDVSTITPDTDLKEFTPTINYLTYHSAWTETLADYLSTNLDDVIASVLDMLKKGDTTIAQIIKDSFDPEKDLYTAEILNKLSKSIADLTSKIDATLLDTLGMILDVDLSAYAKMDFGTGRVGKDGFIEGICEIVKPLSGVLDWLLFGDSYNFFSNKLTGVQNLITVNGYSGYAYGLVPLLEALGVILPDVTAESNTENTIMPLAAAVVNRLEAILVDPVNEALALIPNLLYFINANGLAASVNHLLGAALALVDKVNEEDLLTKLGVKLDLDGDGVNDTTIDLNGLINKLLADKNINAKIDIKKIALIDIIKIVEALTGLELTDFVRENGIENFYLGQITYFRSANGSAAFRMEYSSDKAKDRSDLITVLFNYLIEAALYGDNAKAIDILINGKNDDGTPKKETVGPIIEMLTKLGIKALPGNYHWNYMNEDSDDVVPEPEYTEIVLPATPFNNYLTYCTDWTQRTADYLYDNLGTLVDTIIKMTNKGDSLAQLLKGKFNLYQAEYLNKILDATKKLYDLADAKIIKLLGMVLSCDLSKWDGLAFADADIIDAATFAAGLTEIVEPIYSLLDWLLFGKDYGFFVDDMTGNTGPEGKTLINIAGADGYINGLAPIFIALGVQLPEYRKGYTCETLVDVDGVQMTFFSAVIKAVLARVDIVLANPVDEALDLLPGLLYFINANGVSTAAYNLLGGVLNAVNVLVENGIINLGGTSVEEYVETKLGLNVKNLDLEGIVKFLEAKDITKGIKIYDVFKGIYTVDGDKVTFTPDLSADGNILEKFYCGEVKPYTYSGIKGWQMVNKGGTGRGDMITTLLSIVLEVLFYEANEQAITDIIAGMVDGFTVENFRNLKALLTTGVDLEAAMKNIDWVYFNNYATDAEREEAIKNVILNPASNVLPATQPVRTMHYLEYDNNWNRETAKYIDDNIVSIVDLVIAKFVDGSDSLTDLINNKLNLYSDDVANKLLAKIGGLLKKLDDSLIEAIGVVLDVDLKALTAPVTGVTDKTTFVAALANRLSNIGNVLDWLLFDQQMTFFTDLETGAQAKIVLNGGEGYKYGLAPILEAIGVDTHITVPEAKEGTTITARVLVELLTNVCDRIDEVLADPINEVLALLPELIYFVNANGVSVSAMNLVAPIDNLITEVGKNIGKDDLTFASLIKFDLSKLDFEGIFALVLDKTGIDAQTPIGEYLAKFYFGQLEPYQSYDGVQGFRMVYSETEKRYEFVTIFVTLLLDVISYGGNKDAFIKLLGNDEKAENIYKTVMAFLTGTDYTEVQVPMRYFDWKLTQYANKDDVLSPMTLGSIFEYVYGPLYTREMGEYITKFLPHFIDTMITLLGVEIKGKKIKSLEDLLKQLIGESIYKTDLLNKLLELIQGLVPKLKDAVGEELFNHLAIIVNKSIGVDLNYWNNYKVNEIKTGDQAAFVSEVVRMLRPAYPILEWLLCNKELAFFNNENGENYIVIESAQGYAYGIIPLLEALDCEGVLTIDAYIAAAETDKDNILKNILNPLLTKINKILADPVNQVLELLPAVIYFINSEGLDTVVRNTLNALAKVLETVEPVVGKDLDLATLFGFDFKVTFEGLLDQALKGIEEKYGFKLSTVATEAIKELTVGKVVTFDSLSGQWVFDGKQAYTMVYAGKSGDQVDMVTIILRLLLRFISDPQNVKAIEAMLKPKLNENGYKFLTSLLDNFSQMVSTPDGMDKVMYTVYYIFYSANVAATATNDWLAEFNGNYSFLNQLFATSDLAFMRQLEKSLGDLLNKYTPDIADDDEIVPNGFIRFFKAIIAFFKKIFSIFKR